MAEQSSKGERPVYYLEDLQIGRDRRLRQIERGGDVIDVDPDAAVQEPQDAHAHRRSEAAQHLRPLLGIDDQEIARHAPFRRTIRMMHSDLYQLSG